MIEGVKVITLLRDCKAIAIPAGTRAILPKASTVQITQALGGNFTVQSQGNLFHIAAEDADALGKVRIPAIKENPAKKPTATVDIDQVRNLLKTCYDPEIPINIVELGLIYRIAVYPLSNNGQKVKITMTLTAPGCGMGNILAGEIKQKILTLSWVDKVEIEVVFDPPWDQQMMSEAAKLHFGIL